MSLASLMLDPAYRGDAPVPESPSEDLEIGTPEMEWPPMIRLDPETENRLVTYLDTEIHEALTERAMLVEDWKQWQTDYWAKPETTEKNFPFTKAANIVIPMTAISVEAIHARLMNTLFSVKPWFSIRPRSAAWIDVAKPVENWLQTEVENPNSVPFFEFASQSLMEYTKLGTGVSKVGYEKLIKKTLDSRGDLGLPRYYMSHNGPTLDYVPLANFIIRVAETDPQNAPWCGEQHEFSWAQLKRMAAAGRMEPEAIESIKTWHDETREQGAASEYQDHVDELAKTESEWKDKYEVDEIWLSFDVDVDGWDEEIVVDYHRASRTVLSARYNWHKDLRRPYRHGVFIPVEGRFYGIGVGKQNEQFQAEITTIHRQRLDNATLANMRMIALKKVSGYGPKEPIFPGKMWFLDNPREDIIPIQMSEVYPSSIMNEESAIRHSEKRSGVNEMILGIQPQGTPGTATGDLTRLEQGSMRFTNVLRQVRRWYSLVGQDLLSAFQQYGDQERHWVVLDEKGSYVDQFLRFPAELVSVGAAVEITVTDSITNRQTEQQQWMALFQLIRTHYGETIGLAIQMAQLGLLQDPSIILQIALKSIAGSDEALKRVLETFTITATERFLLGQGGIGNASVLGGGLPTGIAGPPSPEAPTGMEGAGQVAGSIGPGLGAVGPGGPV